MTTTLHDSDPDETLVGTIRFMIKFIPKGEVEEPFDDYIHEKT